MDIFKVSIADRVYYLSGLHIFIVSSSQNNELSVELWSLQRPR